MSNSVLASARRLAVLGALALAAVAASPMSGPHTFAYQDTINTPNGTQQNISATITVAHQSSGATQVTLAVSGKTPTTITIPANGTPPAPQGSPTPQQAQAAVILQRVAILAQIRKAVQSQSPIDVQIPVLPPGALAPLKLPATLSHGQGSDTLLAGSASTSTTATIDPQKAKVKGINPIRRAAERVKNAATPSHVTVPDQVTATLDAQMSNRTITLSGGVTHSLSAKGQTTTLTESWTLKPSP